MIGSKVGWSVTEWCSATSMGRTKCFELLACGELKSVTAGRRRIITTSPAEYLARLAREGCSDAA